MLWWINLTVYLIGLLPLALASFGVWAKFIKKKPERKLQKQDWKKEMVYLCQFPLVPHVRSISPFALKLEAWLRMKGIKYENVFTMEFSQKGQIPYIQLNGEEIADSRIIIDRLSSHFNVEKDRLDASQLAVGHMTVAMLENHTAETGFYYRYGHHMKEFLRVLDVSNSFPSANGVKWWGRVQPTLTKVRSHFSGVGRHEMAEIGEFANKDLRSLSAYLGSKPFFLGEEPSLVDCAILGQLAQFLYIDIGFPQKDCLLKECKNVVALVERMQDRFFPDWSDLPQTKSKTA